MKNWGTIIFYVRQKNNTPQNFEFTGTDILRGYELVLSERIMGNGVRCVLGVTDHAGVPPLPAFLAPKSNESGAGGKDQKNEDLSHS